MAFSNRSTISFTVGDGKYQLVHRENGMIECNECLPASNAIVYWCEHIKQALVDNEDGRCLWVVDPVRPEEQIILNIPVFPTVDLWTEVGLTHAIHGRYEVRWHFPDQELDTEARFLMFLNPGEGRQSIREVLIQQMLGNFATQEAECKSPAHGYQAQMEWERHVKTDAATVWYEKWCIYTTNNCLYCEANKYTPDPDLVPDRGRTAWTPDA